ncbi:MAG TPA: VOC family protein [Chloroflexia bacterium]|nr:VOC family protein [Chloroflexia bacterium]
MDEGKYETQLGFIHLKVRDLDRALAFYSGVLGWQVVERMDEGYAALTADGGPPAIVLQSVGPAAPQPSCRHTGLYHVAFLVPDRAALAAVYRQLTAAGVAVAPVDHCISWTLYCTDPDGNGLAFYWDTRATPGGALLWRGRNRPLPSCSIVAAGA